MSDTRTRRTRRTRRLRRLATVLATVALLALAPVAGVAAADATGGQTTDQTSADHGSLAAVQETDCTFPVTRTDATGTEVTLEERPERVTTLQPSAAQTMWEIGGKSQVVGVSKNADYLAGADERTNISTGGFGGASVEKVVGTQPDLVLAPNLVRNETVRALRDAGLTVFKLSFAGTIDDVARKTTLIGRLTGNCAGAAEANAWMTANVEAAGEATADVERPTVLYPLPGQFVVGQGTFITEMLVAAGGENVFAGEIAGYKEVNSETILAAQPDVVVFTDSSSYLAASEPFSQLEAVQAERTVQVNTNWMNQPAPRSVVYAVRNLTRGFHPDAAASATFPTREEAVAAMATPTPTETATSTAVNDDPTPEPTDDTATTTETTQNDTETATTAPGLGAVVAVLSVTVAALLARRRR
ncbi:PGF-CTERM-anchored ABC transporter substrate-binding protein [Halobaculum sp. MBLA0147]|uniref:PGF-CTERM-anchored ABC transporter substrate-binding protein n=1 Tax=Halobaculum sp. MBLA0147 TaxID=3079934 RepID=UPI003525E9F7